ncbi:LysR family glycine cleavage system transcriptional activator [Bradyrhizobium japonicum]|uniref:LysR substrate-binding domain-containing protein n=1 Tax=Bradyrhizobium diazoefficiens TaxID=1355477 RepID=UPI00348FE45F
MSANGKISSGPKLPLSELPTGRRLPPLKALLAFEAASRRGSFSLGAEEVGVTASAVSYHIQQLEEFLGVSLFKRHAGRSILTNAGRAYANEVELAFRVISDATALVAPQSQRGNLTIAAVPSFASKWLQPRLSDFLRRNSNVDLRLSTLSGRDDIETARFDVAITHGTPPSTTKFCEPLLKERVRPLCSPALAASLQIQAPADLLRGTLIHSVNPLSWAEYMRQMKVPSYHPEKSLWVDRSAMAIEAAVNGLGIVLESDILAQEELLDGRLVAPLGDDAFYIETTSYFLVKPRTYNRNTPAWHFEAWLRSVI